MRALTALALAVGVVIVVPGTADAAPRQCRGGSDPDEITAECPGEPGTPSTPTAPSDPDCQWVPMSYARLTELMLGVDPNLQIGDQYRYYPGPGGRASREGPDGEVELGEVRQGCDTGNNRIQWVGDGTPEPDPVDVAGAEARRQVPLPELAINPGLDVGGVVNLGMWLAVANPDPISVTVTGRGTTVTAVAALAESTWDMGDGTTITCEGGGVPIERGSSAYSSTDEGPCGHTYGAASRGSGYDIEVTTTWTVTWSATDGRSGTAADVVRTATFEYEVDEIQTVGTGG